MANPTGPRKKNARTSAAGNAALQSAVGNLFQLFAGSKGTAFVSAATQMAKAIEQLAGSLGKGEKAARQAAAAAAKQPAPSGAPGGAGAGAGGGGEEDAGGAAAAAGGPAGIAAAAAIGAALVIKAKFVEAFQTLANPAQQLAGLVAPIQAQVRLFDPARVERFNMALEDLSAAAGAIFAPVIDAVQAFADDLNTVYTQLIPAVRPLVEILARLTLAFGRTLLDPVVNLARQLTAQLRPTIEALRPVFEALAGIFTEYMGILSSVMPLVTSAFQALATVLRELLVLQYRYVAVQRVIVDAFSRWDFSNFFGRIRRAASATPPPLRTTPRGGPRTVAARAASFVGVEDIGRNARLAAFGGRSALDRIAEATEAARDAATAARDAVIDVATGFGFAT